MIQRLDALAPNQRPLSRSFDEALAEAESENWFKSYRRVPHYICRCLESFGLSFDRAVVERRLAIYYSFIGSADRVMDEIDVRFGRVLLHLICDGAVPEDFDCREKLQASELASILAAEIPASVRSEFLESLGRLLSQVEQERTSNSIASFIECRRAVGGLAADVGFLFVLPWLPPKACKYRQFFNNVGAAGNLVDSLIDLRADEQAGLLGFSPTLADRWKLLISASRSCLSIAARNPRLIPAFGSAILDISV